MEAKQKTFLWVAIGAVVAIALFYVLGRAPRPSTIPPPAPPSAATPTPRTLEQIIREDLSAPAEALTPVPQEIIRSLTAPPPVPSGADRPARAPTPVPKSILDSLSAPSSQ